MVDYPSYSVWILLLAQNAIHVSFRIRENARFLLEATLPSHRFEVIVLLSLDYEESFKRADSVKFLEVVYPRSKM